MKKKFPDDFVEGMFYLECRNAFSVLGRALTEKVIKLALADHDRKLRNEKPCQINKIQKIKKRIR